MLGLASTLFSPPQDFLKRQILNMTKLNPTDNQTESKTWMLDVSPKRTHCKKGTKQYVALRLANAEVQALLEL